jgi:hypothetical protein
MNASGVPSERRQKNGLGGDYTKAENITGAESMLNFS